MPGDVKSCEVLQVILRACCLIKIERATGKDVFAKLASRPMPGNIPDKFGVSTLTPSLSHPMGEGVRRTGEGMVAVRQHSR